MTRDERRRAKFEEELPRRTLTLARYKAKRLVEAEIRAEGGGVSHWSAKDISIRADEYFAAHRDEILSWALAAALASAPCLNQIPSAIQHSLG